MNDHRVNPVVYGAPRQIEILMESVARLIEHEPDEVFKDHGVRHSGEGLAGLIRQRLSDCPASGTHEEPT